MQLTTHTDYALRTLICLSLQPDSAPMTVHEIARRYDISANHVAKVAQTLTQLGYINSLRGRGGGLVMAQAADTINLGTLVRETENLKLLECFAEGSQCAIEPACKLKNMFMQAQQAFLKVLDGYTLADVIKNGGELKVLWR
ncbi:RrF2 family transcriptional regulator [Alcanivorax sediminis]|uniref:Rrf2 family transcriptional regulator n=1 Tax=Alcanivorax sediminis TaxID=2663008 RepID=A0A6N7LV42_9GAMM|nr:Rrf2 family transcriptional regulator [Alcanivorax sediminis]MQX52945.1 Rrf2 family transcriptional regulator [Alcanivorax sediminis]